MTQGLARYHSRAPRYILSTEDESLIRVAGPKQIPWEEGTEIRNISLTGLSFTAPNDLCPVLGEVIKIQFKISPTKQMACHAIVTRMDPAESDRTLVAVHFYKLEMAHRIALAQGLSEKIKKHKERFDEKALNTTMLAISQNAPTSFWMLFLFINWMALVYILNFMSIGEILNLLRF